MKILITGKTGIAGALAEEFCNYEVYTASRSNGYDIANWQEWAWQFDGVDVFINCAYNEWHQIGLLEHFASIWKDNPSKTIINIGSKVTDYSRSERNKDREYFAYRVHKQSLQTVSQTLSDNCKCRILLINPGPVDTPMISFLEVDKMSVNRFAKITKTIVEIPEIRRVDVWQ
jgi:hypothetical protein